MLQLVTRAEFARRAGISKPGANKLFDEGGKLSAAFTNSKVDLGHPDVQVYLKSKGVDPTMPDLELPDHTVSDAYPDDGSPQTMVDIQELSLREIGERFGGQAEFTDWLKSLKVAEEIREKRLKNDQTDGSMIERDVVENTLFGYINETNRRLLTDVPKTIVRQAYAHAKSGLEIEKAENEARSVISKAIESVKRRISKVLRDAATSGDKIPPLGEGTS